MNRADDVLTFIVVDGRVRIFFPKVFVANPLIGAEQANLVRDGFVNERFEGRSPDVLNDAGDHVALGA